VTRRVIVHAGWPKTATTTLQQQLRIAWPNLAGRPFNRPGGDACKRLMQDLIRGRVDGPSIDALFESSWHDRSLPVVVSNESLVGIRKWQHGRETVEPLAIPGHLATSSWPAQVVFTLREPAALVRSHYRYAVRDGYFGSYRDFLEQERLALELGNGPFSLRRVIEAWERSFGRQAITIAWMDVLVQDPARFWGDLATATGVAELAGVADVPIEHRNPTMLGPMRWELAVNRALAPKSDRSRGRYTSPARRLHNRIVSRRLHSGTPEDLNGGALEHHVVASIRADITWLTARYGSQPCP
jgi:hypothetical protein